MHHHRSPVATLAALALAAGLAAPALAQCTVYRLGMPDFDQRRSDLPNAGRMYCVPTATANALAYIANHGYPSIFNGPKDWQSQAQYDAVTDQLTFMGAIMGTDPSLGTGTTGWLDTMRAYAGGHDGLIVGSFSASGTQGVNPMQLASHMRLGSVVMPVMGWYADRGGNRWERTGGHVVTMWGGFDLCGRPDDMRMAFRDPANDGALFAQGDFASTSTGFETRAAWTFKYASETAYQPRPVRRLTATGGFLDGFGYILPAFGLTTDPVTQDIDMRIPLPLTDDPGPRLFDIDAIPAATSVVALVPGLMPTRAFAITRPDRVRGGTLHAIDVVEGTMAPIDTLDTPRALVAGRDGSLYVAAAGDLLRYVPNETGGYGIEGKLALPAPADAMVYDDERDEMAILCVATRRLLRVDADLRLLRNDAIPTVVALAGAGSVAIDPADGREWVASSGSPTLTALRRDPASGRLLVAQQTTLPGIGEPRAVQFGDDGTLYAVDGGAAHAFARGVAGGWAPSASPLDGMRTGPVFAVGRGRSNYDPATMDDVNVLPPDTGPGEPDCNADLDLDGRLTVFDFLEFQNLFDRGSTWADFDHDGELTIFDFLAFQNAFDQGC